MEYKNYRIDVAQNGLVAWPIIDGGAQQNDETEIKAKTVEEIKAKIDKAIANSKKKFKRIPIWTDGGRFEAGDYREGEITSITDAGEAFVVFGKSKSKSKTKEYSGERHILRGGANDVKIGKINERRIQINTLESEITAIEETLERKTAAKLLKEQEGEA